MKTIRRICLIMAIMMVAVMNLSALCEGTGYTIGIIQLVQHEALDAATQGFMDALTEKLGEENVTFDYQNANGETANCATIVNGFVSARVDLIMANATPALQAAFNGTETIPVLGTSITDYATALDLDGFDGTTGFNVSGTSDLAPLDQQAQLLSELFPDAKTVGLLYCSAEPNSRYQIDVIEPYLQELGYDTVRLTFSDSNDIASVVTNAVAQADVLYIPTDNTAANNTEVINNIALPAGVPSIAGEAGICAGCGVATLSISYYDLGYVTGEMAYKVLAEGADIAQLAIEYAPNVTRMYNPAICDELGIQIPEGYEPIG